MSQSRDDFYSPQFSLLTSLKKYLKIELLQWGTFLSLLSLCVQFFVKFSKRLVAFSKYTCGSFTTPTYKKSSDSSISLKGFIFYVTPVVTKLTLAGLSRNNRKTQWIAQYIVVDGGSLLCKFEAILWKSKGPWNFGLKKFHYNLWPFLYDFANRRKKGAR